MQRYLPDIQGDQVRFGPSGRAGPGRSRTTGRWSTTSASAAAAGCSTSGTPRRPRRPRAWRSAGCWPRPRSSASRSPSPAASGPSRARPRSASRSSTPFDADRQADERRIDLERRSGHRRVGHRRRDLDERLHAAERFGEREHSASPRRPRSRAPRRRAHARRRPPARTRPSRRSPGSGPTATSGRSRRNAATRAAFDAVALHPQVERPQARAARGSSRAARARPPSRSGGSAAARRSPSSEVTATPRIVSECPARYFVAEWKTMSAPERERPLEGRRGERVVDDDQRADARPRPPDVATTSTRPRCRRP